MRSQAALEGRGSGVEGRGDGWNPDSGEGGRESGTRRKKVYGYLKAANELRQTYSAQLTQKYQEAYEDRKDTVPDVEPVIYGNEEIVLFPTYSRRHIKTHSQDRTRSDVNGPGVADPQLQSPEDAGYWQRGSDKYEDDRAIVDVDVKGWIYSPHQSPMNRKNRILISLGRRLSGIPAPDPASSGANDDAFVNKETNAIINGNAETLGDIREDSSLSQNDIAAANAQLMDRLSPFLTNPVAGLPATVFFFNNKNSQSRTVSTNAGGHFHLRVALDFVPTNVRVLAAEHLSATSEINLIEPRGVSVISDIDDTIKHSAIASGTKDMFRNTFVRDLGELTIPGVKEWYAKMAELGVGLHYVSNSPWQLYPLLKSYFKLAGLPLGSFHLKQYSGMMQGFLEPTSERKRPTLEKIMQDFPDRRFVLVGDSGEADLEAYTELAAANPGKILAIFIRDVTTSNRSMFFDKSVSHLESPASGAVSPGNRVPNTGTAENRPPLPPRRNEEHDRPASGPARGAPVGQLIDLDTGDGTLEQNSSPAPGAKPKPPVPRRKPVNLQTSASGNRGSDSNSRQAPPVPAKRGQLASTKINPQSKPLGSGSSNAQVSAHEPSRGEAFSASTKHDGTRPSGIAPASAQNPSSASAPPSTTRRPRTPPSVPPPRKPINNTASTATTTSTASKSTSDLVRPSTSSSSTGPYPRHQPTPPRSRSPLPPSSQSLSRPSTNVYMTEQSATVPNKNEETWRRRWARAQEILDEHDVILASWRAGGDVQDLCVAVIESAQAKDGREKR